MAGNQKNSAVGILQEMSGAEFISVLDFKKKLEGVGKNGGGDKVRLELLMKLHKAVLDAIFVALGIKKPDDISIHKNAAQKNAPNVQQYDNSNFSSGFEALSKELDMRNISPENLLFQINVDEPSAGQNKDELNLTFTFKPKPGMSFKFPAPSDSGGGEKPKNEYQYRCSIPAPRPY